MIRPFGLFSWWYLDGGEVNCCRTMSTALRNFSLMKLKSFFTRRSIDFEAYLPEILLHCILLDSIYILFCPFGFARGWSCLVTMNGQVPKWMFRVKQDSDCDLHEESLFKQFQGLYKMIEELIVRATPQWNWTLRP